MADTRVQAGARAAAPTEDDGLAAIELVGVEKEFTAGGHDVRAVEHGDLRMPEGEFFSLLGPSGCGKTTTLRMVAGFEEPTAGQILLHGRDMVGVPPFRRDVNMGVQRDALPRPPPASCAPPRRSGPTSTWCSSSPRSSPTWTSSRTWPSGYGARRSTRARSSAGWPRRSRGSG